MSVPTRSLVVCFVLGGVLLLACSGPSKSQAMEIIQRSVKEDGSCTLSVGVLSKLKVQHTTKGLCVPKDGSSDQAKACLDALVAARVTKAMPDAYMLAWPDDVSSASLKDVPAYERRARNLVYSTCVELGDLRNGRFACADAGAKQILSVSTTDKTHADVRYARDVVTRPTLAAIEAACGTVSRPPGESTVKLTKSDDGAWALESTPAAE